MRTRLVDRLAELSRGAGEPVVIADGPDVTVVRDGGTVLKAHAPRLDPAALAVRLRVAAHPLLAGILLAPLGGLTGPVEGRQVSRWPYGTTVAPDAPEAAPWRAAGRLTARLHAVPADRLPGPLPPMSGQANAARALAALRATLTVPAPRAPAPRTPADPGPAPARTPAAALVLRAWERLPAWARDEEPRARPRALLCHGDLHLGQLVRHPAPDGPWHLIDVDDLGLGEPAWDLARPAAGYATGLIPAADWAAFLAGYRAAGGPAVAPGDDLWPPEVDVPARALTVQLAARALVDAVTGVRPLDDTDHDLLAACARIAAMGDGTRPGGAT
ncbi:phosphotransferase [Streptomyces sp. WMMC500]|uniref:phosphotransferase n=1 Tax=Streptomyces sp. WMMC500 TaxID=3015154 RepID=UPI00248B13F1|nr:phosphotransferase [Streptomyces sp. WMMC500]WBB60416.1 phosphotransferase [Streptomyces sp. WMMC500]